MTEKQKELFDKEVFKWQINDSLCDPKYEIAKHFYELGLNSK